MPREIAYRVSSAAAVHLRNNDRDGNPFDDGTGEAARVAEMLLAGAQLIDISRQDVASLLQGFRL